MRNGEAFLVQERRIAPAETSFLLVAKDVSVSDKAGTIKGLRWGVIRRTPSFPFSRYVDKSLVISARTDHETGRDFDFFMRHNLRCGIEHFRLGVNCQDYGWSSPVILKPDGELNAYESAWKAINAPHKPNLSEDIGALNPGESLSLSSKNNSLFCIDAPLENADNDQKPICHPAHRRNPIPYLLVFVVGGYLASRHAAAQEMRKWRRNE